MASKSKGKTSKKSAIRNIWSKATPLITIVLLALLLLIGSAVGYIGYRVQEMININQTKTAYPEQQLNTLQGDEKSMSTTISELKQEVESLRQENLRLQESQKADLAEIVRVKASIRTAEKDIEALNRVACCIAGNPFDYYTYIEGRFGKFRGDREVEFGDGQRIGFDCLTLK